MKTLILSITAITIVSCSSANITMQLSNKTPRGVSINNVLKNEHSKAYMKAESYCARYAKVPRILTVVTQEKTEDFTPDMATINYECLKPNS